MGLVFELRDRALVSHRGFPVECAQERFGVSGFFDPLRVFGVVGGNVEDSAGLEAIGDQRECRGLQQATLVMASLGPRIREEHPHTRQRLGGNHVFQYIHRVAAQDADVRDLFAFDLLEELREPGAVDLDGDEIDVRFGFGHRSGGGSGARSDLDDQRSITSEPGGRVEGVSDTSAPISGH